jgi:hypothetical protein
MCLVNVSMIPLLNYNFELSYVGLGHFREPVGIWSCKRLITSVVIVWIQEVYNFGTQEKNNIRVASCGFKKNKKLGCMH